MAREVAEVDLRAVLFDWDGTLLDSADACWRSYQRLFRELGIAFDREIFESSYSPDWYRTYEKVGLPRDRWDEADAAWLEMYADESCALVDGTREALEALERSGVATALVTSGSRERVRRELARHGVAFEAVVFGDDFPRKKPHPDALNAALDRLAVSPGESAYVGDSPEDVRMARAAGVYAVGIAGAFPNRAELVASEPDLLATDLLDAVRQLLSNRKKGQTSFSEKKV